MASVLWLVMHFGISPLMVLVVCINSAYVMFVNVNVALLVGLAMCLSIAPSWGSNRRGTLGGLA